MLISDEYRALNTQLHQSTGSYGAKGAKWGPEILELATSFVDSTGQAPTILDYGCGKGSLAKALGGMDVREYDPAIPGKDAKPDAADIVVCTDVLEHIEPDCLSQVLLHLQHLAKSKLFFCISTRPAHKVLPDGRNAHLIVRSAGFWLTTLANYFNIDAVCVDKEYEFVQGVATPVYALKPISYSMAVSNEERNAQVAVNVGRVKKRVASDNDERLKLPDNGKVMHLCCGGPSLIETWHQARNARIADPDGIDIATVSVAHKLLTEHGCAPDIHIDCDPREHKARQIGQPIKGVRYWLASCIHPSYLDLLDSHDVALWHAYNGDESRHALELEPQQRMIVGGGSAGLRALSLLYYAGYRKFVVHGLDGSHSDDSKQYAAPHLGKVKQEIEVRVGGRWFKTSPALMVYSRYFFKQQEWMSDAQIELLGDGMLKHMVACQPMLGEPTYIETQRKD